MKTTHIIIGFVLLIISSLSSYFIYFALEPSPQSNTLTSVKLEKLDAVDPEHLHEKDEQLHFKILDLTGKMRSTDEWKNKVMVLNFWATWCPPCVKEIPFFTQLQEKYAQQGLQFVGIAIDSAKNVRQFIKLIEINYPVLVEEQKAIRIAESLGNQSGILPFTVVVNRDGEIITRHLGEFTQQDVELLLMPLLQATNIPVENVK